MNASHRKERRVLPPKGKPEVGEGGGGGAGGGKLLEKERKNDYFAGNPCMYLTASVSTLR